MTSTCFLSDLARSAQASSAPVRGIPSRSPWSWTGTLFLALAITFQYLVPPGHGQILSAPGYWSEAAFEANPGGSLPPHRMNMTVLDALGNPVAGATFSASYLSVEESKG